jgi:hypothetical protein
VNTLDEVARLYVKSGPGVVFALADEGVEGDDETTALVLVELMSSSPSSSFSYKVVFRTNPRFYLRVSTHSGRGTPAELKLAAKS